MKCGHRQRIVTKQGKLRLTFAILLIVPVMYGCGEKPEEKTAQAHSPATSPGLTVSTEAQPAGPRVVDFGPGLRIDYRAPRVEVDCEVILREGELELFCYGRAPVPKDHESILRTEVPAEAIYQALGLIGLTPGHTAKFFVETQTLRMPEGDPVDVFVRYEEEGRIVEKSACEWMLDAQLKRPMAKTHWLFTGSERMEDGAFAANYEGTIVTVVDFPSSLLSLPTSHSDSDAELWLRANTPAVPPLGTKVTMILRPVN